MEWETDRGLQARIVVTLALIAVLPLAFIPVDGTIDSSRARRARYESTTDSVDRYTLTMTAAINYVVVPVAEALTEARFGSVPVNLPLVFVLTLVGLVLAYVTGGDVALESANARVVDREEAPELHARVDRLSQTVAVPTPDVALVDSSAPNAFAAGRSQDDSTVAVTSGLRELAGAIEE